MHSLKKYFPDLSNQQFQAFNDLLISITEWNDKINVISRKDIDHFEERHILHSLSIAKFIEFKPGTRIIDIGTGGGFPGLPLAILFPDCHFTLVDSIGKKIKVVNELVSATGIENVQTIQARAEDINDSYDFVISRAVAAFPKFYGWTKKLISKNSSNALKNGIIYLKGGDLSAELGGFGKRIKLFPLDAWYNEDWFNEKYIVYLAS